MENILLIGYPNSGKSTLFNNLTGQNQKTGNYSGITVTKAEAELLSNAKNEKKIKVIDLPGINNLNPKSLDEGITITTLLTSEDVGSFSEVVLILDYNQIEPSLALLLELKETLSRKPIVIINKVDKEDNLSDVQIRKLEELLNVHILTNSNFHSDMNKVDEFIRSHINFNENSFLETKIKTTKKSLKFIPEVSENKKLEILESEDYLMSLATYHHNARKILNEVIGVGQREKSKQTEKIDSIVTHPLWGGIIFFSVFYIIFHSIYTWSGPLMDLIDGGMGLLAESIATILPDGFLKSLIVDGIIAGVGGVIIFLPQIVILFVLLSLLEQSGYIARASFVTDRIMSFFGLNGKAFLPYLSGFACSIPGIMAARTIPNRNERLATMLTLPMITCSARLPVYVLLIGTFVPKQTVLGIFDSQALSFFFLYFIGGVFALIVAKIFRLTLFKGRSSSFFIDFPQYQFPSVKLALSQGWKKGEIFLKKAGTVILGFSILLWFASTFPSPSEEMIAGKSDSEIAAITLENSAIGKFGKVIEPVLEPIGMDWRIGSSMVIAFGARELFVSAMGTIFALGEVDEESETLRQRLQTTINPKTNRPLFSPAVAWSILIFFVFALQCTSTVAVLKREFGSWKYPVFAFVYLSGLGYLGAFIAYQTLS